MGWRRTRPKTQSGFIGTSTPGMGQGQPTRHRNLRDLGDGIERPHIMTLATCFLSLCVCVCVGFSSWQSLAAWPRMDFGCMMGMMRTCMWALRLAWPEWRAAEGPEYSTISGLTAFQQLASKGHVGWSGG